MNGNLQRYAYIVVCITLCCAILSACGLDKSGESLPAEPNAGESASEEPQPTSEGADSAEETPEPTAAEAPHPPSEAVPPRSTAHSQDVDITNQIRGMTIEEKLGQLVLVGFQGTEVDSETAAMMSKSHVGGFILYKNNLQSSQQMVNLLNQLKAANHKSSSIPLWLSVDQEGGLVNRMPDEFTKVPPASDIGRVNRPSYTYGIYQAIGKELSAIGFNMDFAPVLDINSNPNNPVIGSRAFGTTPSVVKQQGLSAVKGLSSAQVIPVVKHFPGHGDTSVDSHLALPVVGKSYEQLESFEWKPFKAAIDGGADVVMVAHLLVRQIDHQYPSSMSSKLMTGVLREKLGFKGVIITDDMTMGGISDHYKIGEAAVRSIRAGSDIILIGHGHEQQLEVLRALKEALNNNEITEERLDESLYRILRLKSKAKLEDTSLPSADVQRVNEAIQEALKL
ncbi:beta-N-acetylhexosaminidase [Paenibacillus sp. GCM10023252]|uniref:beta-N-acetylhexosaminidase n=1 Tax=Paenibacillus sp. GCM10023252 TaxID=3252649 RepID=UPI003623E501